MAIPSWVEPLFQAIDAKDTARFSAFLSEDVTFRFGNAEAVHGKEAVMQVIDHFFQAVDSLQHQLAEGWETETTTIVRGEVCYTRHDGTRLQVPFANIMTRNGEHIGEYLIYVDASQLFAG